MTAFDRFEPQLPQLMDELAPARVPDYFDDMLQQTARTRQRPRWSSLERWIPMGVIARTNTVRQVPWRPIAVAAILIVALAITVALLAGSRQPSVPAPFGPAANGEVLIGLPNGDIAAIDPVTGVTRPVIATDREETPIYAADGRTFQFGRLTGDTGLWVAAADGSGSHRVFDWAGYDVTWVDWTQAGDRIIAMGSDPDTEFVILLIDPTDGTTTTVHPGRPFLSAAVPFGGNRLLLSDETNGNRQYWLMDPGDPSNPTQLATSAFAINEPALSPDGTKLTYSTWEDGLGTGGSLHVFDLDTGQDVLVTTVDNDRFLWQVPRWMPDGKSILAPRWGTDGGFVLSLVPADGGEDRAIGPARVQDSGGATAYISPDGGTVFAVYHDDGVEDGKIWSIDVATGEGHELPWPAPQFLTWQRVGP